MDTKRASVVFFSGQPISSEKLVFNIFQTTRNISEKLRVFVKRIFGRVRDRPARDRLFSTPIDIFNRFRFSFCCRLKLFLKGEIFVDTGYIIDKTLRGGRVGFYVFSQSNVIWKNLSYRCNGKGSFVCCVLSCDFAFFPV